MIEKEEIIKILKVLKIHPIDESNPSWRCLKIEHPNNIDVSFLNNKDKRKSMDERNRLLNEFLYRSISKENLKINGLYCYKTEKDNRTLYIGKGKPICKRVESHFFESFKPLNHDVWTNYFFQTKGNLKLYIMEINGNDVYESELLRKFIEIGLTIIEKPIFESLFPSGKKKIWSNESEKQMLDLLNK